MLSNLIDTKDRQEIISAYQTAWTHAYLKHFSGRAISCMSQVPEIALHSLLQDFTPEILFRNSDDFYPEVRASHPWHIFVNAYNSKLTEHLNVIPDWDMFQTAHPFSSYHAAARCISGGPVMITDIPGEHDLALLEQISSKTPTASTIVLRPGKAKAVSDWENYSDGNVLKIRSKTVVRAALLGLFNISEREKHAFLSMADFTDQRRSRFVVHSHRSGQIFRLGLEDKGEFVPEHELIHFKLKAMGWYIITASPLLSFSGSWSDVHVAVLGLQGKMSGAAGVVSQSILDIVDRCIVAVRLKALGVLRIWLSESRLSVKEAWLLSLPAGQEAEADDD